MVAAVAVVTVMAGYIWQNNYPKMSIKTASSKAGIEANLPSYVPSNYKSRHISRICPREVTLSFNASNHDPGFQISQRHTDWDSGSLLDNFVAKASSHYQAVQGQV